MLTNRIVILTLARYYTACLCSHMGGPAVCQHHGKAVNGTLE